MRYITKEQAILVHNIINQRFGGDKGILSESALESALMEPFQSFGKEDLYNTVERKAARLAFGLIKNHPFTDGNKRIGIHLMICLLVINGSALAYNQQDLIDLGIGIASSKYSYDDAVKWILDRQGGNIL